MMMATTETARSEPPQADIPEENGARAGLYAVLSHLFHARPDARLLQALAAAESLIGEDAGVLGNSWRALCAAARAATTESAGAQFDALFVSPGLPAVSLYASSHMRGARRGQLLSELREDLSLLGFARSDGSSEYEDHIAALCDVMRGLIAEEAEDGLAFERQRAFFRDYLGSWHSSLAEQIIAAAPEADFYHRVARFADAFMTHETQYFDLA